MAEVTRHPRQHSRVGGNASSLIEREIESVEDYPLWHWIEVRRCGHPMEPDLQICKRGNRRRSASPRRVISRGKDRATAEATADGARRRRLAYTKVFRKR